MRARNLLLALTLLPVLGLPAAVRAEPPGMIQLASPHPFPVLVERLRAAITANGMLVVAEASASVGAARRGVTIPGDAVVMVFRNDFAVRMLAADQAAGIEAPIRFHVVAAADGTAALRWRTPGAVFAPYLPNPALAALAAELDPIFAGIARAAVAP